MTDRFNSLTVVLENDVRDDDAKALISAIRQFRGVVSVSGNVSDLTAHVAQVRANHELTEKLWRVLHPERPAR